MFQDLLGRLNGKSEVELENAQEPRAQLQRNLYTERRWGILQFVSGGLLVGDRIHETGKENGDESDVLKTDTEVSLHGALPFSHRAIDGSSDASQHKKHKRLKKSRNSRAMDAAAIERTSLEVETPAHDASIIGLQTDSGPRPLNVDTAIAEPEKTQRRAEKAERKLRRKIKRENRHATKAQAPQGGRASPTPVSTQEQPPDQDRSSAPAPIPLIQHPRTVPSVRARDGRHGRHAVRERYIKHKKMVMMDSKALNEVGYAVRYFNVYLAADNHKILMIRA